MSDIQEKPLATIHIVCSVVIEKDGKYLLVQEKKPDVYGKWNLPAGRVDQGETLEQAAVRETKEECGFDVELTNHLITLHQTAEQPVLHAFSGKIVGGKLSFPKHEILDAKWFAFKEIISMKKELRNPEFILSALAK